MVKCTDLRYFILCVSLGSCIVGIIDYGNRRVGMSILWLLVPWPMYGVTKRNMAVSSEVKALRSYRMFMFKPKWLPCMNLCHYRALSYRAYHLYLLTLNSQFVITKFTKSAQPTPYLS